MAALGPDQNDPDQLRPIAGRCRNGPIAAAEGADVIVLDQTILRRRHPAPACVAVVNPNRQDEDGALPGISVPPVWCSG